MLLLLNFNCQHRACLVDSGRDTQSQGNWIVCWAAANAGSSWPGRHPPPCQTAKKSPSCCCWRMKPENCLFAALRQIAIIWSSHFFLPPEHSPSLWLIFTPAESKQIPQILAQENGRLEVLWALPVMLWNSWIILRPRNTYTPPTIWMRILLYFSHPSTRNSRELRKAGSWQDQ